MPAASISRAHSRLPSLAGRRLFDVQAVPAYLLCLVAVVTLLIATRLGEFDHDRALFVAIFRDSGIVLLFGFAARWIGFRKLADPIEQVMLLFFSAILFAFCSIVFASNNAPMADDLLNAADAALFGLDRKSFIDDLDLSRMAVWLWSLVYNSLAATPALALLLLNLAGQHHRAWILLTALLGTALASIATVALLPAYGTPPFPYEFVEVLDGARDGSLRKLDGSVVTGIITFPSMHAADAVILAIAFGWLGRWALPLVALQIAMFASAFVVGGHYGVDLIAGGVLGYAMLKVSQRLHARLPHAA